MWVFSCPFSLIMLKVASGSLTLTPHLAIKGRALLNSAISSRLSPLTSISSKSIQYSQYWRRQMSRNRNSPFDTQSSPRAFLLFIFFFDAWNARIIAGLDSNSSGIFSTSLTPLSTSARLRKPLPFTSKPLQSYYLFAFSSGVTPKGISLSLLFVAFPISILQIQTYRPVTHLQCQLAQNGETSLNFSLLLERPIYEYESFVLFELIDLDLANML